MSTLQDPGRGLRLITPSDTVELNYRGIYVAGDGTMNIVGDDNHPEINVPVFAGSVIPSRFKLIKTGTTAILYGIP